MQNEVVRHVCVRVLKNYLVRSRPCGPVALGSKLVRAGASPEDVQGIWRDVVSEIARDRTPPDDPTAPSFSNTLRDFLDVYQAVIGERACKPPRPVTPRGRPDERARV